jgi:predicted CoA-binding protein
MDRAMELMRDAGTIAVVGVSSDPTRDSHDVARYLMRHGYKVYMVNPTETEVLGEPVYASVRDLPEPVDIVDIFRRPEFVGPIVEDAVAAGAKAVWMQLRIVNEEAAERAREGGLEVVMDRCTKIEHARLLAAGEAPRRG